VRTVVEPVHKACLAALDPVTITGQWPVCCPLLHDQLHRLDATVEMRMEVSGQGRIRDLILLLLVVFLVPDQNCVPEDALLGKELLNKIVPIALVFFLALGSLWHGGVS